MKKGKSTKATVAKRFAVADEYLINGHDKAKAMVSGGYKQLTATRNSGSVFDRPEIIAYINAKKVKAAARNELTEDWIIQRLMALADSGRVLAKFKKVQSDGAIAWDFTGATQDDLAVVQAIGVDYYTEGRGPDAVQVKKFRIKEPDVRQALVDLGRTLAMFTDKVEVNEDLADRIRQGQKRAYDRNKTESDPTTRH